MRTTKRAAATHALRKWPAAIGAGIMVIAATGSARAQENIPTPPATTAPSTPALAPTTTEGLASLLKATAPPPRYFKVTLNQKLRSGRSKKGEVVRFVVADDVPVSDTDSSVLIPKGSMGCRKSFRIKRAEELPEGRENCASPATLCPLKTVSKSRCILSVAKSSSAPMCVLLSMQYEYRFMGRPFTLLLTNCRAVVEHRMIKIILVFRV